MTTWPRLTPASLPRAVETLGARDRDLAGVTRSFGPPPLWARRPGFATLARIILEQQVTLASGRAAYERLRAAAGGRVTPARVAGLREAHLRRAGLTRQKASYCRELAVQVVERRLSLPQIARLDDRDARDRLVQVPGIGPWTADIYLLMALRRRDVWPDGDLALVKAAQRLKRLRSPPTPQAMRRIASRWTPWRAVAARMLWHYYLCTSRS